MENALIHGGDITAANSPDGDGAVFTLRLPRDGSEVAARDGDAGEGGSGRSGDGRDGRRNDGPGDGEQHSGKRDARA
jgi:two-component system sensor histidine kinase MtrB